MAVFQGELPRYSDLGLALGFYSSNLSSVVLFQNGDFLLLKSLLPVALLQFPTGSTSNHKMMVPQLSHTYLIPS